MASLNFTTLDVFTTRKFAGNPLAVCQVPKGVTLTQEQKQTIAVEFNLSETTFLHPCSNEGSEVPEWPLDIFTVKTELPFAGHPTIGTACHILGQTGKTKGRFKVKAGIIELDFVDGVAKASIPHNTHVHSSTDLSSARMLEWQSGLKPFYQSAELKTDVVSPVKGMNFALVELKSLEELAAVVLPGTEINFSLDEDWDVGPCFGKFFVQMPDQGDGVRRLRTRMIEGSFEDPATGSACCALTAYLVLKEGIQDGKVKFDILQAVEIGRPSEIGVEVEVKGGEIQTIILSGKSEALDVVQQLEITNSNRIVATNNEVSAAEPRNRYPVSVAPGPFGSPRLSYGQLYNHRKALISVVTSSYWYTAHYVNTTLAYFHRSPPGCTTTAPPLHYYCQRVLPENMEGKQLAKHPYNRSNLLFLKWEDPCGLWLQNFGFNNYARDCSLRYFNSTLVDECKASRFFRPCRYATFRSSCPISMYKRLYRMVRAGLHVPYLALKNDELKARLQMRDIPLPRSRTKPNLVQALLDADEVITLNFLDLPPEVRTMIYEFALTHDMKHRGRPLMYDGRHSIKPALLQTCRLIRQEGSEVFYKSNRFQIERDDSHRWNCGSERHKWVSESYLRFFVNHVGAGNMRAWGIRPMHPKEQRFKAFRGYIKARVREFRSRTSISPCAYAGYEDGWVDLTDKDHELSGVQWLQLACRNIHQLL
ncbi:Diaminopimelate epimerase-like protein [Aureobasidium subglaciale]|nr:Diaminopimelate epimerase-like protein [Aureobasidium subglaciale]KAI5223789.1 Diaminopimelate epimerase-like protein [Aureobasidium subglaciale]KAI5227083.1 Diaminopimelate epimerase-like protein [Aureobasidium subglaciale]KAI5262516.1 Diaminopimelate epimerase-like protein [Aureobasidium subglaciale]